MSIYTAKITAAPSTNLDSEYAKGSVDANIYRDGVLTDMEVTLVTDPVSGFLDTWGSPYNWCSDPDLLNQWAAEAGQDRWAFSGEIVVAVRAANR